jgi:predicted RNA-binding protein with TRAM domain
MGDGQDGILSYSGFTVYTYRETSGNENVVDVE